MSRSTHRQRVFTYEEALDTFPQVRDLTRAAIRQIESIVNQVQGLEDMANRKAEIEESYDRVVQAWALEVQRVGCEVKGLWLVDWDCGDGYYCWKWPEETIRHFHDYDEGFAGRVAIV